MAPSAKRGKIKAQVFGDVSSVVVSLINKTGQTLGFVRNTAVDAGDRDVGGDGFSPHPNGNNDR